MTPVTCFTQVDSHVTSMGFSVLFKCFAADKETQRMTLWYLRDANGWIQGSVTEKP